MKLKVINILVILIILFNSCIVFADLEDDKEQINIREIKEELDAEIEVGKLIDIVEYDYPTFHLSMQCFWCELKQDKIELKEHEAAKWLNLNEKEMLSVEWLPADRGLIKKILL
jgi:8-oxo-dGTP diphosphatase